MHHYHKLQEKLDAHPIGAPWGCQPEVGLTLPLTDIFKS